MAYESVQSNTTLNSRKLKLGNFQLSSHTSITLTLKYYARKVLQRSHFWNFILWFKIWNTLYKLKKKKKKARRKVLRFKNSQGLETHEDCYPVTQNSGKSNFILALRKIALHNFHLKFYSYIKLIIFDVSKFELNEEMSVET